MEREQVEKQIDKIRSKHVRPILRILKTEHSMYHGELAEKLNMSPSGLNAIIKKMIGAEIPLIEIDSIGKFKKYSLSPEVTQHIDEIFPEKRVKEEKVITDMQGLFLPIQRFVEICGERWRENLNQLLCGEDEGYSQEVKQAFDKLIKQMQELYKNNDSGLMQLKHFIRNEVVIYLLEEYLKAD